MNHKQTCHPENPESGQQTNRQENLDTCHTCAHYNPYRHRPHLGITPEPHCHQNPTNTHPCPHYEPADQ